MSKRLLEYTGDKFGNVIEKGSYIIYSYQRGHSVRLRVARVIEVFESVTYTWEEYKPHLKVVAVEVYFNNEIKPLFRPVRLEDPTNTIVIDKDLIPQNYIDLMARAAGDTK